MVLLSVRQLEKSFGERVLFSGVSFSIAENQRVGLVGANGTGKTTLLRMLCGEEASSAVSLSCPVGVMEQDLAHIGELTLLEAALDVFSDLMAMETEIRLVNERLEAGDANRDGLIARQHALQESYHDRGGLTFRSRARAALLGLGFEESQLEQATRSLSGGETAKLKLARLLLRKPPLLLLDEPTNHLDIPALEWLEELLRGYGGAMLVVSHDRWFLDRVTQRTLLLENQSLRVAEAPYTEAMRRFAALDASEAHHAVHIRREMKRLEQIIAQQRRWNRERNIRMAESKQKTLDKLKKTLPPPKQNLRGPVLAFSQTGAGEDVLHADGIAKAFGGRTLFSGVSLDARAGERLFLLGPNGCGKSTLLKILALLLAPDEGFVEHGPRLRVGYYDQAQANLTQSNTLLEEMTLATAGLTQLELRNALASVGFRGDDVYKTIGALSGGERARVCLLKLMLEDAHLLLLDEPTNHLDIASREALEAALEQYDGTLIAVSHDRYFMRRLEGKLFMLAPDGLKPLNDVSEMAQYAPRAKTEGEKPEAVSYREKKARAAEARKKSAQLQRCEERIARLEEEMQALQQTLHAPEYASDYARLAQISEQLQALQEDHEARLAEWLSLQP